MNNKLTTIFASSRPISWINTAYPFAATYLFLHGATDLYFWLGTFYFLIPFNLLMYGVNDVFDYESDKVNPRKNSVEGAIVKKDTHRSLIAAVIITNVPFIIALAYLSNSASLIALFAIVCTALAYSVPWLRLKEIPVIDSMTSSSHFVLPMVVALAQLGQIRHAIIPVLAFYCWGMASHAFGAVQDVVPDRAAGIRSIATQLGARFTVRLAAGLYLCSALLVSSFGIHAFAIGLSLLLYIFNVLPFWNVSEQESQTANTGWKRFIWLNWITGAMITITLLTIRILL